MYSTHAGELAGRDYGDINNLTTVPSDAPYPYSSLQIFGFVLIFTLTGISFLLCCIRIYGRTLVGNFGWDDVLMVIAQILLFVEDVAQYKFMRASYIGIHYYDIPKHKLFDGWYWWYVSDVAYNPILSLIKISCLLWLLRFGAMKQGVRIACLCLILFETLKCISTSLVCVFQCWPIEAAWNFFAVDGHCIREDVFHLTAASINLLTCVAVGIVPFFIFLDLKINRRLGVALVSVCGLGLVTIIISGIRVYYIWACYYTYEIDRQYSLGYSFSAIECALAIITTNLPALWPVYRRWFPHIIEQLGLNQRYEADVEIFAATVDPKTQGSGRQTFKRLWSIETIRGKKAATTPSSTTLRPPSENSVGNDGDSADITYETRWTRKHGVLPGPRAVYAHRSIGGTSFTSEDNAVPAYWRDLISKSRGPDEDDEDDSIELYHGIVKQMGPGRMGDDESTLFMTDSQRTATDRDESQEEPSQSQSIMARSFLNL